MITVNSSGLAILLCILTMIGWGSWANTQKLAGRERWPFELFYWDYAIGVAIMGVIFCFTFGVYWRCWDALDREPPGGFGFGNRPRYW